MSLFIVHLISSQKGKATSLLAVEGAWSPSKRKNQDGINKFLLERCHFIKDSRSFCNVGRRYGAFSAACPSSMSTKP